MDCRKCENLYPGYPIKVIDIPSLSFADTEVYHFEDGYKCTWNGMESLNLADLQKGSCRCKE